LKFSVGRRVSRKRDLLASDSLVVKSVVPVDPPSPEFGKGRVVEDGDELRQDLVSDFA
jgi:hypothetical protein